MRNQLFFSIAIFCLAAPCAKASPAGDPVHGKTVFNQCSGCHSATVQDKVGPHLGGVFDRKAGSVAGFRYSRAMAGSNIVWNEQMLDAFLAGPGKMLPGTSMPVAVRSPQDRADVIAYLKSLAHP